MEPETRIQSTISDDGKVIVLSQKFDCTFSIWGCTLPTSLSTKDMAVRNFAISAEGEKKSGIVALTVNDIRELKGRIHVDKFPFILRICEVAGSRMDVDLKRPWVPKVGRLLQACEDFLSLKCEGVIYSTFSYHQNKPGYRYVPDGDILCKFAYGDIEKDELENAASEYIAEESAREELPKIRPKVSELEKLIKLMKDYNESDLRKLENELNGHYAETIALAVALAKPRYFGNISKLRRVAFSLVELMEFVPSRLITEEVDQAFRAVRRKIGV
jgi:hypothetical protein